MFELEIDSTNTAKLKVVGCGGAGGNAVNRMIGAGLRGVEFIAANTDMQALNQSLAPHRIQLGANATRGLGSGGDPSVGRRAAEEDEQAIADSLADSDMVFITAGMGGGTGTGSAPVVARLARQGGALTVAVVTKPFAFEGRRRMRQAEEGLAELRAEVDTLIVIPNQRLLSVVEKGTSLSDAFSVCDEVLLKATKGISDLVTVPGLVNLDFADVKAVMSNRGNALMGTGRATGAEPGGRGRAGGGLEPAARGRLDRRRRGRAGQHHRRARSHAARGQRGRQRGGHRGGRGSQRDLRLGDRSQHGW